VRPEVRHLAYFVALAEELNFTRAAARVNVVQQALSAGVAQLEALVGVQLFERTTRRVRMTAAGEDFLPRAREALAAMDLALATARRHADGAAGQLVIGLSSTCPPATPELLRAFAESYPDVALDVRHFTFGDPYAGLLTRETDVAIVRPPRIGATCTSLDELFEAARVGRALGLVPESVARSRAWPGLAFVRVADVEPSVAAIACRPGESRAAVRNFLALAPS
jgi:DNA-binding transcriptional LysR family regulator